jgi:hypothetical protein
MFEVKNRKVIKWEGDFVPFEDFAKGVEGEYLVFSDEDGTWYVPHGEYVYFNEDQVLGSYDEDTYNFFEALYEEAEQ